MSGPLFFDDVEETTTTTGTGPFALAGALAGFRPFSVVGDQNTFYYRAKGSGSEYENGLGTWNASGNTISRTQIRSSSNADAAVSFSGGTKNVFLTVPASTLLSVQKGGLLVPKAASFTAFGAGLTITDKVDRMQLALTTGAVLKGGYLNSIATPYTVEIAFSHCGVVNTSDGNYAGLGISNGTAYQVFIAGYSNTVPSVWVLVDKWTNSTTHSAILRTTGCGLNPSLVWLRITDDGTTRKHWVSANGKDWLVVYSEATNTFLTPSRFAFVAYNNGANSVESRVTIHHWQVTASVLGDEA